MTPPTNGRQTKAAWLLLFATVFLTGATFTALDLCALCGQPIAGEFIYYQTDEVTAERKFYCKICAGFSDRCFTCSLPVKKTALTLSDGRFFCDRDARTAILDEAEVKRLCAEVKEGMDRTFSRFLTLPTNITIAVVDRINLMEFKIPGNDFGCPNILGYFNPSLDRQTGSREISILGGLTRSGTRATCAHEYGHAWIAENVSTNRKATLSRDAEEGFCELISYLLMDSRSETAQKDIILKNPYTRGQIHLFIDAAQRYGLNEVLDWIRYGIDDKLETRDSFRIRKVALPVSRAIASNEWYSGESPVRIMEHPFLITDAPARLVESSASDLPASPHAADLARSVEVSPAAAPETAVPPGKAATALAVPTAPSAVEKLTLKGITWTRTPLAIINNQSFTAGETAKVRFGKTNITIKCLQIRENSVRIQILASGEEQELSLKAPDSADPL